MRILWFSNTPAAGEVIKSSKRTGGWMKSLDKALQDKVELHVAFYDRHYPAEFQVGKTTYHQIAPQKKSKLLLRRFQIWMGNNPDIPLYLNVINKVKPDIIHIHGTERPWIQLAKFTDIPVVLSVQAILTVMNYKYFSGITRKEVSFGSKYLSDYKDYIKEGAVERENLQYVKYVLGRTDWDRRVYSVLAPHAHYFVCNEILRDGFYKTQWREPVRDNGKLIIHTTTGSLLFKGLETICEAIHELERLGVDVEWRVAGISESSEINRIVRHRMGSCYPQKGLKLLGSLDEETLIKKMLEAHIYVNASHQDNSPNSLCEAMLIGMPCIATCAGGSSTMLHDGVTGILVQDGDPWAISGAILELEKNKNIAYQYANNARKEAMQRHDSSQIVDNLLSIYHFVYDSSIKHS